jgi:hypothetical protein
VLPPALHFEKDFQQIWIKETMILGHDRQRFLGRIRGTIASVAGQGIVGICNSNDPGFHWDLVAFHLVWIPTPIEILMVVQDN